MGTVLDFCEDTNCYLVVHEGSTKWWNASQVTAKPMATAVKAAGFCKDDRVRFRHNGKSGTVTDNQIDGHPRVVVTWDGVSGGTFSEEARNLILLHSPAAKAAEGPHPIQPALDAIDEERRKVGLQITALQNRSRELKKAKELLVRGV